MWKLHWRQLSDTWLSKVICLSTVTPSKFSLSAIKHLWWQLLYLRLILCQVVVMFQLVLPLLFGFSCMLLARNQKLTAWVQACKLSMLDGSDKYRILYSVVSSAYCWCLIPKELISRPTDENYNVKKRGPRTESCGTQSVPLSFQIFLHQPWRIDFFWLSMTQPSQVHNRWFRNQMKVEPINASGWWCQTQP